MSIINNNNSIINGYTINIATIIINIICQIKSNIFELYYFQNSNITLKIKGICYNVMLGNGTHNFKGINYLKVVFYKWK